MWTAGWTFINETVNYVSQSAVGYMPVSQGTAESEANIEAPGTTESDTKKETTPTVHTEPETPSVAQGLLMGSVTLNPLAATSVIERLILSRLPKPGEDWGPFVRWAVSWAYDPDAFHPPVRFCLLKSLTELGNGAAVCPAPALG